jgi:GNAT superfamily N-acetyltransferase
MTDLRARVAEPADTSRIEALITEMFRDLGTTAVPPFWHASLRAALTDRLGRDVAAFVTVDGADLPVAVAIGVVDQRLPSPRRPTGRIGYVEWLATDGEQRRRGAARMALVALLHWFDGQEITTVDVHASEAARPLYLDLGFVAPAAMPLRRSR